MNEKIIIFSAPSGSGKTTILKRLIQSDLQLAFSISATVVNNGMMKLTERLLFLYIATI
jgi:ATP/maltotriose-dependent transcriptional regulator MalT